MTKMNGSFVINSDLIAQKNKYSLLNCLTDPQVDFIELLIKYAFTKMETKKVDFPCVEFLEFWNKERTLENRAPVSISMLRKRVNQLVAVEVLSAKTKKKMTISKGRPTKEYYLNEAVSLFDNDKDVIKYIDHRASKAITIKTDQSILTNEMQGGTVKKLNPDSVPAAICLSEKFWSLLCSCMRHSVYDRRKNEPFTTTLIYSGSKIVVETSAQANSEIAHIDSDIRTILSLITLISFEIECAHKLGESVKNSFIIDIVDLLKLMDLKGDGANRDTIRKSLRRLRATEFTIKLDPDSQFSRNFCDTFGLPTHSRNYHVSFISDLISIDDSNCVGKLRKERYYKLSIDDTTFTNLQRKDEYFSFIAKRELLLLQSGLVTLFYNRLAWRIKRYEIGAKYSSTLKKSMSQFLPSSAVNYPIFEKRFLKGIKKLYAAQNPGVEWTDVNKVDLLGYEVYFYIDESGGWSFESLINQDDSVIGIHANNKRIEHQRQLNLEVG